MKQIITPCLLLAICFFRLNYAEFSNETSIGNVRIFADEVQRNISQIAARDENHCLTLGMQEIYFARHDVLYSFTVCDAASRIIFDERDGDIYILECYLAEERSFYKKLANIEKEVIACVASDCQKVMKLGERNNSTCVATSTNSNLVRCSFMEHAGSALRSVKPLFEKKMLPSSTDPCVKQHFKRILDVLRRTLKDFNDCKKIMESRLTTVVSNCLTRHGIWDAQAEMETCSQEHLIQFRQTIEELKNGIGSCIIMQTYNQPK